MLGPMTATTIASLIKNILFHNRKEFQVNPFIFKNASTRQRKARDEYCKNDKMKINKSACISELRN